MYGYMLPLGWEIFVQSIPIFFHQETIFRERAEMEEDAELIATQRAELQAKIEDVGEGWHPGVVADTQQ